MDKQTDTDKWTRTWTWISFPTVCGFAVAAKNAVDGNINSLAHVCSWNSRHSGQADFVVDIKGSNIIEYFEVWPRQLCKSSCYRYTQMSIEVNDGEALCSPIMEYTHDKVLAMKKTKEALIFSCDKRVIAKKIKLTNQLNGSITDSNGRPHYVQFGEIKGVVSKACGLNLIQRCMLKGEFLIVNNKKKLLSLK